MAKQIISTRSSIVHPPALRMLAATHIIKVQVATLSASINQRRPESSRVACRPEGTLCVPGSGLSPDLGLIV